MNTMQMNDNAFVHIGSPRLSATLGSPLFQMVNAADIVKSAWINVPRISQIRDFAPILSPMRAILAPRMKEIRDVRAS